MSFWAGVLFGWGLFTPLTLAALHGAAVLKSPSKRTTPHTQRRPF